MKPRHDVVEWFKRERHRKFLHEIVGGAVIVCCYLFFGSALQHILENYELACENKTSCESVESQASFLQFCVIVTSIGVGWVVGYLLKHIAFRRADKSDF